LTKLKTIFGNPTITAGNAPGLNDGAAAQVLMKKSAAESLGITPLYTLLDMCSIAAAPELLPVAPALAIKKCLSELDMSLEEVDILEINEAFAAVPLVSCKLLACSDFMKDDYEHAVANIAKYPLDSFNQATYDRLLKNLNVNGGAVAVGHVNCASGARIMMNAGLELRRRGGGIAVCAICGGLTQGDACVLHV
jgi:acetyl-CoA C-acetyltransferase